MFTVNTITSVQPGPPTDRSQREELLTSSKEASSEVGALALTATPAIVIGSCLILSVLGGKTTAVNLPRPLQSAADELANMLFRLANSSQASVDSVLGATYLTLRTNGSWPGPPPPQPSSPLTEDQASVIPRFGTDQNSLGPSANCEGIW